MKTLNLKKIEEFILTDEEMINVRGGNGILSSGPGQNGGDVIVIKI